MNGNVQKGRAAGMCPELAGNMIQAKKRRADNVRSAALSSYLLHLTKIDCREDQMI